MNNPTPEELSKHPMQRIYLDQHGTARFRSNPLVRFLLDAGPFDMNTLVHVPADDEDREQFAQLIGYSVSGYGELSYVSDKSFQNALLAAQNTGAASTSI